MSFHIADEKLFENYKAIWTKSEDLQNIDLNSLPVYENWYLKDKIKTYGHKVYTNFYSSNLPEDSVKCESFTVIILFFTCLWQQTLPTSIYRPFCLQNCVNISCLILINGSYKCYVTTELI